MRKTKKRKTDNGRRSGYPSFKEIAYHHWRQNSLPMAGEPMEEEAEREYMEEEEEMEAWEGEERRWERDSSDEEPGETP